MTKKEFITLLAEQMHGTYAEAEKNFTHCLKAIETVFKLDEELTITGFGRFYVHKRSARKALDPKRKIAIEVDAKSVPMFKAGDALKLHVNNWLK